MAHRPGVTVDLPALAAALPHLPARLDWIPAPLIAISASGLRARAAAGRPLRYFVPGSVAAYIATHALYTVTSDQ